MIPLFFALLIISTTALPLEEQWNHFKLKHNKSYGNKVEETLRYEIFQKNLQLINSHNEKYEAGLESYYMAANQFADMTPKEFTTLLKYQKNSKPEISGNVHVSNGSAPDSIDWRNSGAVTEVKNQLTCGSCWAFSATGALEGQYAIANNKTISLSEQELLDCSGMYGNGDCFSGGQMKYAFEYVTDHGLGLESDYAYEDRKLKCRSSGNPAITIKGYNKVEHNEEALKDAVGTVGPVSVSIFADLLQFYSGGIFESSWCFNWEIFVDHGVLVVGYDNDPSPYWIIKNSWGPDWGENGYFRLARNKGQCGIAVGPLYPVL